MRAAKRSSTVAARRTLVGLERSVAMRISDRDPTGSDLAFRNWHRLLRFLLLVDAAAIGIFAFFQQIDALEAIGFLSVPLVLVAGASLLGNDRFQSCLVAIGFSWCSWLLVIWSGGATEAHFHGLIVIGLIALYQAAPPVALVAVGQVLLHGFGLVDPALVYNHEAAVQAPAVWGFIHLVAILGAASVPIFYWRGSRDHADESADRASSDAFAVAERRRQEELSSVYATVARRSQSLLERQIRVIEELQQHEQDPGSLHRLFTLDHLATRMNREATSMLVLAGGEPSRRVMGNPPLSEVVRAAVGEIESYTRVDVRLDDDRLVTGPVVAALVHLLSELVENATMYSSPSTRVDITGASEAGGSYTLVMRDRGIGLDEEKLAHYNELLAAVPSNTTSTDNQRLGFEVVSRLADRHGITVQLAHNLSQRGVNASIGIPAALLLRADVAAGQASGQAVGAMAPQQGSSSPRWAQATSRGNTADSVDAARAAEAAELDAVPQPVARAGSSGYDGLSWSYGGHLAVEEPTPEPVDKKRFGRGSRTQVTGLPSTIAAGAFEEVEPVSRLPEPLSLDAPVAWAGATPEAPPTPQAAPVAVPPAATGEAAPVETEAELATAGATPSRSGSSGTSTRSTQSSKSGGLPRRSRGESLPAQLRKPNSGVPTRRSSSAPVSREESRSLLSSYQSRLQAGRKAAEEHISDEETGS